MYKITTLSELKKFVAEMSEKEGELVDMDFRPSEYIRYRCESAPTSVCGAWDEKCHMPKLTA